MLVLERATILKSKALILIKDMIILKVSIPAYQPMNPLQVITWMSQIAKKYSTISIPGVYGSAYDQFPLGLLFNRNVSIHMGQCPVKKYTEQLFHLIETKRLDPTKVISHTWI